MTVKPRFPRYPTSMLPDLVVVADPDLYYSVQALFQAEGITLVDLDNGNHFAGQVNIPQIGMIVFDNGSGKKRGFGFVTPNKKTETIAHKMQNVDATLGCENITPEDGQPMFCVIQVVDDDYLEDWKDLATKIANLLVKREKRVKYPQVVFGITSLCLPDVDNPQETINAVLSKVQGYGLNNDTYAVSHDELPTDPFDDGPDEEP